MRLANEIMLKLHKTDIYEGFGACYEEDLHGGGYLPVFEKLFKDIKPSTIIEVGSWKGRSAIQLAELLKKQENDGVVICIDTWLGCLEHLPPEISESWSIHKYRKNGYPQLYYQFLSNIVRNNVQDVIVPLPNTSIIGYLWLKKHNIKADMVYIDGSHEYLDVIADVRNFYNLLGANAVLCGDDYSNFSGVNKAVFEFAIENSLHLEVIDDNFWIIRKDRKVDWVTNVRRQGGSFTRYGKEFIKLFLSLFGLRIINKGNS